MKKRSIIAVLIWIGILLVIAWARLSDDPTKRTKQIFPVIALLGVVGAVVSLSDYTKVKDAARKRLAMRAPENES